MKLEIPLFEIEDFVKHNYGVNIKLKNIEEDKIELNYFIHLGLQIKEVDKHRLVFKYELNSMLNFLAKTAHLFLAKKLENVPLEWNSTISEVVIDLKKINSLSNILSFVNIRDLSFEKDNIILELFTDYSNNFQPIK